jgi:hypothetical protein
MKTTSIGQIAAHLQSAFNAFATGIKKWSLLVLIVLSTVQAQAQYSNTAIKNGAAEARQASDTLKKSDPGDTIRGPLDMAEVIITAKKYPLQTRVGQYNQPLWSTMRMFPSTRVYVMNPPGSVMYEKWFDIRDRRRGPAQVRMRDEFTFGLGKRLQLDLYSHTVYDGESGDKTFAWRGFSWEIRYALADWGKIWGNPTIYFEHKLLNGQMGIEPKLLLGDRLGKNGIWGLNLIYEGNLAPTKEEQEREYASTASYGHIINNDLTLGISSMYRYNDYDGKSHEVYLGPLLQYRFNGNAYLTVEVMPGLTQESKASRSTIIFAWRF